MPKKKTKKKAKKKKTKKKAKKKTVWRSSVKASTPPNPPAEPYVRPAPSLKKIFAINAVHIPSSMQDECLDFDDEFPLHYANGIVRVEDTGMPFPEWLKTLGFAFSDGVVSYGDHKGKGWGYLGVWGT
jgi:hypothetical protein